MQSVPTPTCEECQAFDAETKRLMGGLFSKDEASLLSLLLAGSMKTVAIQMNEAREQKNELHRLQMQAHIDFTGQLFGKFLLSFDDRGASIMKVIHKNLGVAPAIKHGQCPHQAQSEQGAKL